MSYFSDTAIDYLVVNITDMPNDCQQIKQLLKLANLDLDPNVTCFIVAKSDDKIIACAGIDRNIIKCVAIHPDYQGNQLNLTLIDKTIKYAYEKGYFHLFLYTKPENQPFFKGCGFYPIVEVPNLVVLMENTPVGIKQYCKQLALQRQPGAKIGSIVMNANPFTKGHQYLINYAASQCDWLHLFVVNEDASQFSFDDRLKLVKAGTTSVHNLTIYPSSSYIISKATFPTYFLKEAAKLDQAYMGIDLLIFRNYIAPALHITHRFVGSEPFSDVTRAYNDSMRYWLQDEKASCYPAIELVEIERIKEDEMIISASLVRKYLAQKEYEKVKQLVPPSTWDYLQKALH
ncbi:[citrate (pro-3S)-lyase] ligase [Orbaceae bacterium ESL0727]|nr:[citrate (pro-3S)-lyase] ligase [Orbaceae bacterium ESL0727]